MLEIPQVAFDESGNTGQNLLDPSQSVFVLASIYLSEDQAVEICHRGDLSRSEVHFKKLKKSRDGRKRIHQILQSPELRSSTVKVFAIHKSYMVVTKIVDMLVE